jgi:hypothetical protein
MSDEPKVYLTPDAILEADDRPTADVEVPEWGGHVRVRALSLESYLDLKEQAGDDERQLTRMMLHEALVGEDGEPMLTLEQAGALLDKSATAIGKVMQAIANVTGSGGDVLTEAQRTFRSS